MIILDELRHWDYALLVPLHLLEEVVSLQFSEDLDDCSLHSSTCHETSVIRSGKPLFSDLDSLDWFHSIPNSIALLRHELTCCSIALVERPHWEDQYITFLLEFNLVEYLNAWMS